MRSRVGDRLPSARQRIAAVGSAAALIALTLLSTGTASAATPTVEWGSFTPTDTGSGAQPSVVSGGGVASFTVSLKNADTSTISQLSLKAVTQATSPVAITGLYFAGSTPSGGSNGCAQPSTTQTTLSCLFRNVKPQDIITVQVGYTMPTTASGIKTCGLGGAKSFGAAPNSISGSDMFCIDFVWSTTGATTSDQNNTSHGDVWNWYDGVDTNYSSDIASTYVFKSQQFTVQNSSIGGGNGQSTKIVVNTTLQGVTVGDGQTIADLDCSTSTLPTSDCASFNKYNFGEWSDLLVGTTGQQPNGAAFFVTITIDQTVYPLPSGVNKNNISVYHTYQDGAATVEEVITSACAKSNPTPPCISSVSITKTQAQVTFLTTHNGRSGLY